MNPHIGGAIFSLWVLLIPAGSMTLLANWLHPRVPRLLRLVCHSVAAAVGCASLFLTLAIWAFMFTVGRTLFR
ncbi:MAG TPA: hypothetical protein VHU80_18445 [Polyangiaceae bacterium]|nr:hypothetical protein [Polyangiaceae bacterium]